MKLSILHIITFAVAVLFTTRPSMAQDITAIPSGSFHSVLPEVEGKPLEVDSFYMGVTAVTNSEFMEFLNENPRWRRSQIPAAFAGEGYLRHWESDLNPGSSYPADAPVTRVSWFAANAYCGWNGGRLPTLNEWEYSAQLMEFDTPDEMNAFSTELMGWYSAVNTENTSRVGSTGIENKYGVRDQFGLIMEWVEDFEPPIGTDVVLNCGSMGRMQQVGNIYSYAATVRYITRMSFNPRTTTGMVGFRCAYDSPLPINDYQKALQ